MSQAKVSRIENGVTAADPVDVEKLARALELTEAQITRLVELATQARNHMVDWRTTRVGMATRQLDIAQVEGAGHQIRVFNPVSVIGLLQTSEYARAVMFASRRMMDVGAGDPPPADIYEAVTARLQRHQILAYPDKSFFFVMAEAALSNRLCSPTEMVGQIQRIRELARQDNITVGIIPADAQLSGPLVHGFEVVDDRWLLIDLFNTLVMSRGRSDIRNYLDLFEGLQEESTLHIDAMLDKYLNHYLDLARP